MSFHHGDIVYEWTFDFDKYLFNYTVHTKMFYNLTRNNALQRLPPKKSND